MRSPAEMLRTGADEGRVSGVFEITGNDTLKKIEELTDVAAIADGGEILLTRKLYLQRTKLGFFEWSTYHAGDATSRFPSTWSMFTASMINNIF